MAPAPVQVKVKLQARLNPAPGTTTLASVQAATGPAPPLRRVSRFSVVPAEHAPTPLTVGHDSGTSSVVAAVIFAACEMKKSLPVPLTTAPETLHAPAPEQAA